jgi:hypothetical protein
MTKNSLEDLRDSLLEQLKGETEAKEEAQREKAKLIEELKKAKDGDPEVARKLLEALVSAPFMVKFRVKPRRKSLNHYAHSACRPGRTLPRRPWRPQLLS